MTSLNNSWSTESIFGPKKQEVKANIVTEDEKNDPLRLVKVEIHSLLIAEQNPICTQEVKYKYLDNFDYEIDPYRYGYNSIDALLHAMQDKVSVYERDGIYYYSARNDDRVSDIKSLVNRQLTKEQVLQKKLQKQRMSYNWSRRSAAKKPEEISLPVFNKNWNIKNRTSETENGKQDSDDILKNIDADSMARIVDASGYTYMAPLSKCLELIPPQNMPGAVLVRNELEDPRVLASHFNGNYFNNNRNFNQSEGTVLSNDLEKYLKQKPIAKIPDVESAHPHMPSVNDESAGVTLKEIINQMLPSPVTDEAADATVSTNERFNYNESESAVLSNELEKYIRQEPIAKIPNIESAHPHRPVTNERTVGSTLKRLINQVLPLVQNGDVKQMLSYQFFDFAYTLKSFLHKDHVEEKKLAEVIQDLYNFI